MTDDWGPPQAQHPSPPAPYAVAPYANAPYPAAPYPAAPYPAQQSWPDPDAGHRGRRCAVIAPILLVLSLVPAGAAPFLGIIGLFDADSDGDGGGFLALAVLAGLLGLGMWFAAVVTSIVGLAMARGGYRVTAGVTLGFAVGTVPVLLVVGRLLG